MARRTKLTPETQEKIINALQAGNYFGASCEYAGITERTGYNWLARGREELEYRENPRVKEGTERWKTEEIYVQFFHAVSRASASVEVGTIAKIKQQGDDDWRALAWFMEHRYPDKWGRKVQKTDIGNAGGKPFEVAHTWENLFTRDTDDDT